MHFPGLCLSQLGAHQHCPGSTGAARLFPLSLQRGALCCVLQARSWNAACPGKAGLSSLVSGCAHSRANEASGTGSHFPASCPREPLCFGLFPAVREGGGGQGMEQGHADHIPGGMAGNRTRLSLCKTDQRSRVPAQGLSSSLWVRNQLPPATSWVGCAPGAVLRAPGTLCLWLTMPLAQEASFRSSMAFLRCWSCVLILSLRQGGLQSSGSCVVPSPRCDVLTPRLLAC